MGSRKIEWRERLIRRKGILLQIAIVITWMVMMALLVERILLKPEALGRFRNAELP